MKHVLIIGGGASGMAAAVSAARHGAAVTVMEKKEMPGKKILSTGNGRCNLTNMDMKAVYFRGGNREAIERVLASFGAEDTLRFFGEMGLMVKTRGTLVYPANDQAAAVREALSLEMKRMGVRVSVHTAVKEAGYQNGIFFVKAEGPQGMIKETADALILSCGGKAAPALGSDGSGYLFSSSFGHSLVRPVPALVQLRSDESFLGKTSGVRADARISLLVEGEKAAEAEGEIQFTDYGLSGIAVFQTSRFAARAVSENRKVEAVLDFIPALSREEFASFLRGRRKVFAQNTAEEFLHGVFHRKLVPVILTRSRIRWKEKVEYLAEEQMEGLAAVCKAFRVRITGTNAFDQAQVCAGGIPLQEIKIPSMESVMVKNLYLTGELLDVDGMCGGYNLQWAWATGFLAGAAAARKGNHQ